MILCRPAAALRPGGFFAVQREVALAIPDKEAYNMLC